MDPSSFVSSTAVLMTTTAILTFTVVAMWVNWMARPPSRGGNARLHTLSVALRLLLHGTWRRLRWKKAWELEMKRGCLKPTLRLLNPGLFGPLGQKLGELQLPNGAEPKNVRDLQTKLALCPTDVFVVGHIKAGTTWTVQIVKLIRDNGVESGKHAEQVFPFIDTMTLKEVEALPLPRGFKTHLPYNHLPGGDVASSPAKYVYVYRNPKDRMVSMYHMAKGFSPPVTWDAFFEMQKTKLGKIYSDPLEHVLDWWTHKDLPNVHILCYEDMIKDPRTAIEKTAKFLGCGLSAEVVNKIADQVVFENMKKVSTVNMSWTDQFRDDKSSGFMRKGIVGDWRNHFTKEQSARFDAEIAEKIPKDCGLVFDFGDDN